MKITTIYNYIKLICITPFIVLALPLIMILSIKYFQFIKFILNEINESNFNKINEILTKFGLKLIKFDLDEHIEKEINNILNNESK